MNAVDYVQGADLPDLAITWQDTDGNTIPYATGWSFTLKVGDPGTTALINKSTGITGADTAPNVTIAWATSNELNTLDPGTYAAHLVATRTADSKQRFMPFDITVHPAIT